VIGNGAREHALAWKLATSPYVKKIILADGNEGMHPDWERWKLKASHEGFQDLGQKCRKNSVDLVVVGPENPLADGIPSIVPMRC
jgi:phosphoribosylamine-glycine ligase